MILQVIENLEKLMFMNYNNFCISADNFNGDKSIPDDIDSIRQFFTQNEKVCKGWFMNIRKICIRVAIHCGKPSSAVYHCWKYFADFSDKINFSIQLDKFREWHLVVLMCVEGLIQLEAPDDIQSLKNYALDRDLPETTNNDQATPGPGPIGPKPDFSIKYNWLDGSVKQAMGYFEQAIKIYKDEIRILRKSDIKNFDRNLQIKFITQLLATCYSSLGSHNELKKLTEEPGHSFLKNIDELNIDYHWAIDKYSNRDYKSAAVYAKRAISKLLPDNSIQEISSDSGRSSDDQILSGAQRDDREPDPTLLDLKTWRWPKIKTAVACTNLLVQSNSNTHANHYGQNMITNMAIANIYSELQTKSLMAQHCNFLPATNCLDFLLTNRYKRQRGFSTISYNDGNGNISSTFSDKDECKMLPIQLKLASDLTNFDSSNSIASWAKLERAVLYETSKLKSSDDVHTANIRLYEINARHISASLESKNFKYASKVLLKSLDNVIFKTLNVRNAIKNIDLPVKELVDEFDSPEFKGDHGYLTNFLNRDDEATQHVIKLQILCSELMHKYDVVDCKDQAICCSVSSGIRSFDMNSNTELSGKSFICTADWLLQGRKILDDRTDMVYKDYHNLTTNFGHHNHPFELSNDGLVRNLTKILQLEANKSDLEKTTSIANLPQISTDKNMQIIGSLYHLATFKANKLGEAWLKYADFCYTFSEKLDRNLINKFVHLQIQRNFESAQEQYNYHYGPNSVHNFTTLANKSAVPPPPTLNFDAEQIKQNCIDYEYCLYRQAVTAYEKYLNLEDRNTIGTITSTLRLMKILIDKASNDNVLMTMLNDCFLKYTPVEVWSDILPQILARIIILDKDSDIYMTITNLLKKITYKYPEQIIFAALERKQHEFLIEVINEAKNGKKLLSEVKLLIEQLNKTAILWNELWQNVFQKVKFEQTKALAQLQEEESRLKQNMKITNEERNSMIKQQIIAIMKPLLTEFQKVNNKVMSEKDKILAFHKQNGQQNLPKSQKFSTHEQYFLDHVQPYIDKAIRCLADPPLPKNLKHSILTIGAIWSNFDKVQEKLKKMNKLEIDIRVVLPNIKRLQNTDIPLPGKTNLKLARVENTLRVLTSKTKPKKLTFLGNNGKIYHYLFKFQEDLHLDERIMQMLNVVNTILNQNNSFQVGFRARHYAVTPLGHKSGLIEWVDHTLPMYEIYRAHQIYKNGTNAKKPIEIFNEKLKKFDIQQNNFQIADRRNWPADKLIDLHKELVDETPSDLLSREIWLLSPTSRVMFDRQHALSRSCAVASMLGYIIGLGDRHLDNVLVDMKSTEFVHIDYNVCFEKGQRFKIPETVPFRLTQNMKKAVEFNLFKNSSERALNILQSNSEALITLLDAFLHDPIFDWTLNVEEQQEILNRKREEEKAAITRVLFSSRLAEIRYSWSENKDIIINNLKDISEFKQELSIKQKCYNSIRNKIKAASGNFKNIKNHQETSKRSYEEFIKTVEKIAVLHMKIEGLVASCQDTLKILTFSAPNKQSQPIEIDDNDDEIASIPNRTFNKTIYEALVNAGKEDLISKTKNSYIQLKQVTTHFKAKCKDINKSVDLWLSLTDDQDHRIKLWYGVLVDILNEFGQFGNLSDSQQDEGSCQNNMDYWPKIQNLADKYLNDDENHDRIYFKFPSNKTCMIATDMYMRELKPLASLTQPPVMDTMYPILDENGMPINGNSMIVMPQPIAFNTNSEKYKNIILTAENLKQNMLRWKLAFENGVSVRLSKKCGKVKDKMRHVDENTTLIIIHGVFDQVGRHFKENILSEIADFELERERERSGSMFNTPNQPPKLTTEPTASVANTFKFTNIFDNFLIEIKLKLELLFYLIRIKFPKYMQNTFLDNFRRIQNGKNIKLGYDYNEILAKFKNEGFDNFREKVGISTFDRYVEVCYLKSCFDAVGEVST